MQETIRTSICLSKKTKEELDEISSLYGENRSRTIARMINATYQSEVKHRDFTNTKEA
jgi:metal-responsive CopG/Arc/MetJ family transcriptional regulator